MNRITLNKEDKPGLTGVSNLFIDNYMKDANDAQIKTYLYLLRAQAANQPVCISEIADAFNHTEKEVVRSLQYWEHRNLLSLEYDNTRNICGICLLEPQAEMAEQPVFAPVVTLLPPKESLTAPTAPAKPSYSAEDLKDAKSDNNFFGLLCIVEQYLGRPLSPSDIKSLLYIHRELEFSQDLIDFLLEYCLEKEKRELRSIEKTAVSWYESNIRTVAEAKKNLVGYDKKVHTIMKALGRFNLPTAAETDYINRWINEYGFTLEMILECCQRTVKATDSHRLEYAEGILKNWKKNNLLSKANVLEAERTFLANRNNTSKSPTDISFNKHMRTGYDYDALEKELISN